MVGAVEMTTLITEGTAGIDAGIFTKNASFAGFCCRRCHGQSSIVAHSVFRWDHTGLIRLGVPDRLAPFKAMAQSKMSFERFLVSQTDFLAHKRAFFH
jgi:hypothetical protein